MLCQNINFDKANIQDKKNLNSVLKNIKSGDKVLEKNVPDYSVAFEYYEKAYKVNKNNALLNYKMGRCMFYYDYTRSTKYLLAADSLFDIHHDSLLMLDNTFLLAKSYQSNLMYDSAIYYYEKLASLSNGTYNNMLIDKYIDLCFFGDSLIRNPIKVFIDNFSDSINTYYNDFLPVISYSNHKLFFNSDRPLGREKRKSLCYYLDMKESGLYGTVTVYDSIENTKFGDFITDISYDGKYYLVCRRGDIYLAVKENNNSLLRMEKLSSPINTKADESFACFTRNMHYIYFVSDREGGYGGKDIYRVKLSINASGDLTFSSRAENLGPQINSAYDECSVSFLPFENGMYICSNRLNNSMGGFDVFESFPEGTSWITPVNLGYPINTPSDELFYYSYQDSKHGFLTRKDVKNDVNIYSIEFPKFDNRLFISTYDNKLINTTKEEDLETVSYENEIMLNTDALASVSGVILDKNSGWPVSVMVCVFDNSTMHIKGSFMSNPINGRYNISLPSGKDYSLVIVNNDNYLYCSKEIHIPGSPIAQTVIQNIMLTKTYPDSIIDLDDLFFMTDSDIIDEETSYSVIYRITKMLNDYPDLRIDILGDKSRVESFIQVLERQNIDSERLSPVQYFIENKGLAFRIKNN